MKLRLLLAFVWLAISFALPIFAQEKEEANSFLYVLVLNGGDRYMFPCAEIFLSETQGESHDQ